MHCIATTLLGTGAWLALSRQLQVQVDNVRARRVGNVIEELQAMPSTEDDMNQGSDVDDTAGDTGRNGGFGSEMLPGFGMEVLRHWGDISSVCSPSVSDPHVVMLYACERKRSRQEGPDIFLPTTNRFWQA